MPEQTAPQKSDLPAGGAAADLLADIRRAGGVSMAEYMQRAAAIYYAGAKPFGREGDFITAPEISQLFGEMIGLWCADLWMQAGKPARVILAELGPGCGTLMADILRTAGHWPDFQKTLSVHLVETSPQLRREQAVALKDRVCAWHEDVSALPQDAFSLIISNEFFDALPVRQFVFQAGVWWERYVVWDDAAGALRLEAREAAAHDVRQCMPEDIPVPAEGDIFEASPQSCAIAAHLAAHIAKAGGACLSIDYGHLRSGYGDTVQAVRSHAYTDVLAAPGSQDITAHVDFAALGRAAMPHAHVLPAVTQGVFLNALGIALRAEKIAEKAGPAQRAQMAMDVHRLTAPSAMGDLFKVMCWTQKGGALAPAGFGKGEG